jgi:hypothetical protein
MVTSSKAMNHEPSSAPNDSAPDLATAANRVEDAEAVHRLPGPLGRPRGRLPVAAAAPAVPSALALFNRLTGALDVGLPAAQDVDWGSVEKAGWSQEETATG